MKKIFKTLTSAIAIGLLSTSAQAGGSHFNGLSINFANQHHNGARFKAHVPGTSQSHHLRTSPGSIKHYKLQSRHNRSSHNSVSAHYRAPSYSISYRAPLRYNSQQHQNKPRHYNSNQLRSNYYQPRNQRLTSRNACHLVSKTITDRHGYRQDINGTMCYDRRGRGYIVPNSRYRAN